MTVQPFTSGAGESGHRLTRGIHAVLREEAHLHRVCDPAGGSWHVEQLTEELAERAWQRCRQIELAGGMPAALGSGLVAGWLDATWRPLRDDIVRRRSSIVGVSRFADPAERRRDA